MFRAGEPVGACVAMVASGGFVDAHIVPIYPLGDSIKYAVDHAGGLVFVESPSNINVFIDHNPGWNVAATQQFESGGAKNCAQRRIDTRHRPALGQSIVYGGIDIEL